MDENICTGDHACMRLSGCPSLGLKHLDDPLRDDPVASIDESCVGCGNCGEVADAAILCPSFYRADVIDNPTAWDRTMGRLRTRVIGWLQRRRDRQTLRVPNADTRPVHDRGCGMSVPHIMNSHIALLWFEDISGGCHFRAIGPRDDGDGQSPRCATEITGAPR